MNTFISLFIGIIGMFLAIIAITKANSGHLLAAILYLCVAWIVLLISQYFWDRWDK
jgi:hypothetical protein